MPHIELLDQITIDKIAAGEVIERPASVVKELVENAIDAGSTAVTVEIEEGGISLIRITDNGCGIAKQDVENAFLRHSTSKIRSAEDLTHLSSLGFRGEALSSISAVARVELITKTREDVFGTKYIIEGGKGRTPEETGAPDGTTFLVRQLFFNTPARRKFLKTPMTEASHISDLLTRLALSHPDISFRFINNGQVKLHTSGNGKMKDVIYHIYGREIANNLIPLEFEKDGVRLSGYLGKPVINRGNRNFENYFVNGRYVRNSILAKAIEDGYKDFTMQHRYPFVAFQIEINPEKIDVNVHPSKMELRFSNQQGIYNLLYEAISKGLHEPELIPEVEMSAIKVPGMSEKRQEKKTVIRDAGNPYRTDGTSPKMQKSSVQEGAERAESWSQSEMPSAELQTQMSTEKTVSTGDEKLDYFMQKMRERVYASHLTEAKEEQEKNIGAKESKMAALDENPAVDIQNKGTENRAYSDKSKEKTECDPEKTESNLFLKDLKAKKVKQLDLFEEQILKKEARQEYRIIGQVFETYWLIQYRDSLYIIDQHAAHERVLYERALAGMKKREYTSQYLSPPIILSLSMQEIDVLETFKDRFTAIGFEIEPFGGDEYAVRAIPDNLFGIAKKELLLEMLDSLSDGLSTSLEPELIDEKIASMSCKAAVKGNMKLSYAEMDELINELLSLDNPYHCPHGRPTIIAMTKRELEKKFKRIV
jgi:DNA mismatch repair protein MutL